MSSYFQELLRMRQLSKEPLVYQSMSKPVGMGNVLPIVYGGFTCALAIQAAFHSLPETSVEEKASWSIYSANGLFLGPANTEGPIQYQVTKLRDTRSFATRFIVASQESNGKTRNCFTITIDFTRKVASSGPSHNESRLPLSYSVSPSQSYPQPDELMDVFEASDTKLKEGKIEQRDHHGLRNTFGLLGKVAICKNVTGYIFEETLLSIIPKSDTEQQRTIPDVTQRRNADYIRAKESLVPSNSGDARDGTLPMSPLSIQASFIGFMLDGALAFYPLSQQGLRLIDAGACSTLDFALRFHDDEYDLQDFHCREMRSYCADRDRTFSEALLWNTQGKLIASMSQQCVLRSKPSSKPAKL